jgi:DNA polymerase-3 subunit delta'
MKPQPIFNERTQLELDRYVMRLPHALGVYGEQGSGLKTAAEYIATICSAETTVILPEKNDKVDVENGSITIEVVRRLYGMTRSKSDHRRCVIITAADTMSHAAQNAFLKLLEEPVKNVSFILLAHHPQRLLATVRSRLQMQRILPLTDGQSAALLDQLGVTDTTKRQQLLFLAAGRPAQLAYLSEDEVAFTAEAALLRQARTFVQGSQYERLVAAQAIKGSKQSALKIVAYAIYLLKREVIAKQAADGATLALLERLEHATRRLESNGNVRLVLASTILA